MENSKARGEARKAIPPVRIMEDENEVTVQLEMPGVAREGLEITIDGNTLTIVGRRGDGVPNGVFLLRERRHEDFRKAFTIDESVDREGVAAELSEGILTLRLKVREQAKPRRIAVN